MKAFENSENIQVDDIVSSGYAEISQPLNCGKSTS